MHLRLRRTQLHLFLILALVLPLAAIYATHWPVSRAAPPASSRGAFAYMPATGHNIGREIKRFYETKGGLAIFGLPLTALIAYVRDQPGMDAAVYAPNLDLRWSNDLPGPIMIAAESSRKSSSTPSPPTSRMPNLCPPASRRWMW